MTTFWPVDPSGWISLCTGGVAVTAVVLTGAKFITRLDHLARRQEIAEFKAAYDKLEAADTALVVTDPLLEEFDQLEANVRQRERLARQATCKHENGVTCQEFGNFEKMHLCNDCGALTKTHI